MTNNAMPRHVRVKSVRNGKYVEFEFSMLDDDLSVELIMPFPAFSEFCEAQNAVVTLPDGLIEGLETANPADKQAGLYRQPHQHHSPNG